MLSRQVFFLRGTDIPGPHLLESADAYSTGQLRSFLEATLVNIARSSWMRYALTVLKRSNCLDVLCFRLHRGAQGEMEWRQRILDYQELSWTPINDVSLLRPYWNQHGLPRRGLCRLPHQPRNPTRHPRTDLRPPQHEICKETMSPGMWKGNDPN